MHDRGKSDEMPLRKLRLRRREEQARRHGYEGTWPPERAKINSPEDCRHYLDRVASGEERAGFLTSLSRCLMAYFNKLTTDDFERMGRIFLSVAENPKATVRTRIRAVESAIRACQRTLITMVRLRELDDSELLDKLVTLHGGFLRALGGEDGFERLAHVLAGLASEAAGGDLSKLRACEAMLRSLHGGFDMLNQLRVEMDMHRRLNPPPLDPVREAELEAELETMRLQIRREAGLED